MGYVPPYETTPVIDILRLEIRMLLEKVTGLYEYRPKKDLCRRLKAKSIHASLLIEGNALTTEQAQALFEGKPVDAPQKDVLEMQNALKAYDAARFSDPCSLDEMLSVHGIMMDGLVAHAGCLRSENVGVFAGEVLIHPGTTARALPQVLGGLFEWLRSTREDVLVKSCVFHHELEFIHPFMDGNGRMGRLWQNVLLSAEDPLFVWVPIETQVYQRQQEYYDALARAHAEGDATVFVEFMLETIRDALYDMRLELERS